MPDIPHRISAPRERADDLIAATDSYHADLTINAPIDSVFAAVSSAEGLSGWWTTDTGGPREPGGELRFTFSDGVAVMRVEERTPPALERWTCLGHSGQPEWAGYDGSIWPHHDGLKWLHSVANWTVRSGPVKSGSEKEEQIRSGARSRRHSRPADRGGADSSRPSGASASRHSHAYTAFCFSRPESGPRQDASPLPAARRSVHDPGSCSSRMVCPVGAVSKTMWSYWPIRFSSASRAVNSLNEAISVVHEPDSCSVIEASSLSGSSPRTGAMIRSR